MKPALPVGAHARAVRRELAGADDQRVLEVVRFVDQLVDRGVADGLLAPLRDRLRLLRPPRQLRFPRLLCVPLEPVLVNPRDWRPVNPAFPRTAIAPITALVRRASPTLAEAVDKIAANADLPEALRIAMAGKRLWPEAAAVLRDADVPPEWHDTALPDAIFRSLARAAATALQIAWTLHELSDPATPLSEQNVTLAALLTAAEADGPLAWGMCLTIMLQRFPRAEAPRRAASAMRSDRDLRQAAAFAADAGWAWIESAATGDSSIDLGEDAAILRRQGALLEELAADPAHRRRAISLQNTLRAATATRFAAAIHDRVLLPLQALTRADAMNDAVLSALEADARALRGFDTEARRLGSGAALDARLSEAAAAIVKNTSLSHMDQARLIEILLGSTVAVRLLPARIR